MNSKNIILLTHGDLAIGIAQSVKLILGEISALISLSVGLDETIETIMDKIQEAMNCFTDNKPIVIVTDIPGGSTTQTAIKMLAKEKVYVITGLNLGLILGLIMVELTDNRNKNIKELNKVILDARSTIRLIYDINFTIEESQDGEL